MDYFELSLKYAYSQSLKLITGRDIFISAILFFFIIITGNIWKNDKNGKKVMTGNKEMWHGLNNKVIWLAVLAPYIYLVLSFTVINRPEMKNGLVQLMPFWTIREIVKTRNIKLLLECFFNILMLVPFGFILKKLNIKIGHTLLLGMIFSYSIEISQLITKRGLFELVDDPFHNICGVALGYLLCKWVESLYNERKW